MSFEKFEPSRRAVLSAGVSIPLISIISRRGDAAEFTLKFATGQDPSHPVNKRAREAIDRIKEKTGGRVEINLFPANQLGSDTDLIGQLRNGAVDYLNIGSSILATLVPKAGIYNTGFAFASYDEVWKAVDGDLGAFVKSEIESVGVLQVCKPWDNGFRQLTSSTREIKTPDDLKGFKMRVPPAPILTGLFQALGAGPTPINFNEVCPGAPDQGRRRAGEPAADHPGRQALRGAEDLRGFQPYLGWLLVHRQRPRLAAACRPTSRRSSPAQLIKPASTTRRHLEAQRDRCRPTLQSKGLAFNKTNPDSFRATLREGGFYKDWQERFGDEAWALLEDAVGKLG